MTHNYFRARHGSPPLVLNGTLTDEAQYWAERLLVTGAMEGLDNSRIGISVAVLDKGHISGVKVEVCCKEYRDLKLLNRTCKMINNNFYYWTWTKQ